MFDQKPEVTGLLFDSGQQETLAVDGNADATNVDVEILLMQTG
jgi:hypothetical protein